MQTECDILKNRIMKTLTWLFTVITLLLVSCDSGIIKNLRFDGDFIAKEVVEVKFDIPDGYGSPEFEWLLSGSNEGPWEKISGVWGNQLVLLTSYRDKFIKCNIALHKNSSGKVMSASLVSPGTITVQGNRNTDWFHDAGFGIMAHYLKPIFAPEGGSKEWNDVVNSFDAENFAAQVASSGAGFVMFTLGQNSGDYCSPNAAYDSIMGIKPGDLCSTRDLPMDIIKALDKYHIPLILYLPSNPPVSNKLLAEKFHYVFGKDTATSQFNQPLLEKMIREWSLRYGKNVKGWWFDGLYEWNGIRSTRMDMSLKYNISTHTLAAKAGNRNSIVTYNYGFGKIHANTPYCDYSSGEKQTIDEYPVSRWADEGVQWFLFTYLGEQWGGKGNQFRTEDLTEKAKKIVANGGVLCLEVVPDAKGNIMPNHLEQIIAVGKALGKIK
jgi:hypothetical protein